MAESKGWQACPKTAQSEKELGFGAQKFWVELLPYFQECQLCRSGKLGIWPFSAPSL